METPAPDLTSGSDSSSCIELGIKIAQDVPLQRVIWGGTFSGCGPNPHPAAQKGCKRSEFFADSGFQASAVNWANVLESI